MVASIMNLDRNEVNYCSLNYDHKYFVFRINYIIIIAIVVIIVHKLNQGLNNHCIEEGFITVVIKVPKMHLYFHF
jgi:hypothetical protein